ncbi:hypothetical protein Y032_0769g2197 [Ancylostoma ceylanicum]|uniref:Uncharacterized protein n=1 Tax=Ancylostoma ceylanicum TaxID=53326 RepID=A0A016WFE1_9BILA|nr:hypothetical protein Y032_0769g2197 [Ancylostoma ceylanicum]
MDGKENAERSTENTHISTTPGSDSTGNVPRRVEPTPRGSSSHSRSSSRKTPQRAAGGAKSTSIESHEGSKVSVDT